MRPPTVPIDTKKGKTVFVLSLVHTKVGCLLQSIHDVVSCAKVYIWRVLGANGRNMLKKIKTHSTAAQRSTRAVETGSPADTHVTRIRRAAAEAPHLELRWSEMTARGFQPRAVI